MAPMNCWNLRVTAEVNQGGRKYMEDVTSVQFERVKSGKIVVEYAAFAIFDGHGGKDAAHFARDNLLETIKLQKGFYSNNESTVKKAISDAFVITHHAMWNKLHEWPKTPLGHPSTAGTTASLVIIRGNRMYVANVGDSMVVMGSRDICEKPNQQPKAYTASGLTIDHKPELVKERKRIEKCGGCVMNKSGVNRVVWARPKLNHNGPIRRSTQLDKIPFLAVARSLGDLWSFNSELNEFVVSPVPDVYAYNLHPSKEQFIVLASDGLWNMVRPQECVSVVAEIEDKRKSTGSKSSPAHKLVQLALDRWAMRMMRADNTSVIVVIIERRKIEPSKGKGTYFESWTSSKSEMTASDVEEFDTTADEANEKDKPIKVSLPSSGNTAENQAEKPASSDQPTMAAPPPAEPLQDASISSSNGDVSDDVVGDAVDARGAADESEEPSSSGIKEARVTRSQTMENNRSSAKRKSSGKTPAQGVKTRRMSLRSSSKRRPRSEGGAALAKSPGLRARRLRGSKRSL